MNIIKVLGYIALGMAVSEFYNWQMWRKYHEGLRNGNAGHSDTHSPRYGGGRPR